MQIGYNGHRRSDGMVPLLLLFIANFYYCMGPLLRAGICREKQNIGVGEPFWKGELINAIFA